MRDSWHGRRKHARIFVAIRAALGAAFKNRLDGLSRGCYANAACLSASRAFPGARSMKFLGFLLLLAGWGLVLAAVALLAANVPRITFVLSGIGVEILGLVLAIRAHLAPPGEHE
jgi:hypothetical protein